MSSSSETRGDVDGFDGIRGTATAKRIANWNKYPPSGRWRKIEQVKLKYTYIVQTWYHLDKEYQRKHICPYGMKTFVTKLLQSKRVTNKRSIPLDVKTGLNLVSDDNFDSNDVSVSCTDEGECCYIELELE